MNITATRKREQVAATYVGEGYKPDAYLVVHGGDIIERAFLIDTEYMHHTDGADSSHMIEVTSPQGVPKGWEVLGAKQAAEIWAKRYSHMQGGVVMGIHNGRGGYYIVPPQSYVVVYPTGKQAVFTEEEFESMFDRR